MDDNQKEIELRHMWLSIHDILRDLPFQSITIQQAIDTASKAYEIQANEPMSRWFEENNERTN